MLPPSGTVPPIPTGSSALLADRYRIERELGRGGMAVVYLAHDTRHDRRVAIKFIGDELSSAVGTQRFLQEIKLTAALQHPHVLPVYDSGVTGDNVLYYVMPFIEGGSLRNRLEGGPLPIAEAVRVARHVADALGYAHQRGIVHRDIKPENILFSEGHALVADFGIARLATATAPTGQPLTALGVVVGTPAYMSPEQGFGGQLDHRSDIYSLACVVYEMLTGKVPFNSPAAGQWTEFGLSRMPPSIRAERAEVPEALETELVRALAPSPDDRPASAREFADALEGAAGTIATPYIPKLGGPATRSRRAWRRGLFIGVALGAAALAFLAVSSAAMRARLVALGVIEADRSLVMIAPFQGTGTAPVAAERLLRAELSRWSDVRVLSLDDTRDALGSTSQVTRERAIHAARLSRAGVVVWGRARSDSGVTIVESQTVDVATGATETSGSTTVPSGGDAEATWRQWAKDAAATLLAGDDLPVAAARAVGGTQSASAWSAFVIGHRALERWRLASADSAFNAAVAADPRFAAARAWLAQTMVWERRGARADWRRHADQALMRGSALHADDLGVARAVAALGRRDDPSACTEYGALVARDSANVGAWLGLGDCQTIDSVVVRDARASGGLAFRGDLSRGLRAYEHAVRLSPGAHAALPTWFVERYVFYTQTDRYRHGIGAEDSMRVYAGRPATRDGDIVYVPQRMVSNDISSDPPGFEDALHLNRARMLEFVTAWTERSPGSADAYEALAAVQEERGELSGVAAVGRLSAASALDSAQRLARDAEGRARNAAARVRVLLKAGAFAEVRVLADSLVRRSAQATSKEAQWLAGVAALTGRTREAARLARLGDAPPVTNWDTLPGPLGQAATLLLVQAAAGACTPDVQASFTRLESLIESYTPPATRERSRAELIGRARRLAVPCLGVAAIAELPARSIWDRMQQRLALGDSAGVRVLFDTLQLIRRARVPGRTAADYTFAEAWMLAAVGDTNTAMRHLDLTLNALPNMSRNAVWELAQAAALVRMMVWRADLARARNDLQTSRRWATAVATLWRDADPELQQDVQRMRTIQESR